MKLVIGWLYPTKMNIYGDRGNVIALRQRAAWRGIDVEVRAVGLGDVMPEDADLFFFGGGQDQEQIAVSQDLNGAKGATLKALVEDGAALLAVCGGYQLLGHEYLPHDGAALPGIRVFDMMTIAGPERFIGNVIVDSQWGELVGFENHSGLTHLAAGMQPMGRVRIGRGNNGTDGNEGAVYRNAVGCYLHGSLLPKNPKLADWLVEQALERKYPGAELQPLPDDVEMDAHASARARAEKTR